MSPASPSVPATDLSAACHALMDRSPMPMAELEGAGHRVRYANPAFCRLAGKSKQALVGRPFAEAVQDGDTCLAVLDRVYRGGEAETHAGPDDAASAADWSYAVWPVPDAGQRPSGLMIQVTETTGFRRQAGEMNEALLVSSVRQHELTAAAEELNDRLRAEIAERERAEADLRESERRFREMIDALPAAVYTTDADGGVTHFNSAAVEFSGRMPERGTDRWCVTLKLYNPDGTPLPHDKCPMAIALKENRAIRGAEAILERPDGRRFWFAAYPTPMRDAGGRVVGGINMLVDITERKHAELAAASLAAIVEFSDDAIIGKNLDGVITSWNGGAGRLFGYTAGEAVGQPVTMLIAPDRRQEESEILARLRRGEHIEHFETVRVRKDGSDLEVSLTISPIRDSAGRVVGASKIARDITERRRIEERQQLLLDELAHRGKNLLAVIQTIVSRSLSGTGPVAEARDALIQRIQALARSQSMLVTGGFLGAPLAEIVRLEFEAFSDRVRAVGPELTLNPRATQTFALLVHELATNAMKHGALSDPRGRIAIEWSVEGAGEEAGENGGAEPAFRFRWLERGGPPAAPPTRQGFGRILTELAAAQEFGAKPTFSYAPEGLSYEIVAPLSAVAASPPPRGRQLNPESRGPA